MGIADNLRRRVNQHIVLHNSSITTGASAVMIDPEKVTEILWWEDASFSERGHLEAAEEVASEILRPTVRSRGKTTERCQKLLKGNYRVSMERLFKGTPTGIVKLPTYSQLVEKVEELDAEINSLKESIKRLTKSV